jgi:epoxyqueuosine reductase
MRAKLEELCAAIETEAPGTETRAYVDTGPIVERAFARYSGIGWMGKNTCLINQEKGSWFFLGVVLTSLDLEPDFPAPDRCGTCTRCLEACPTGALVEPYLMDASRCISYLNIELKGSIPAEFRPAMGVNVFGCDICQDVCPWNAKSSGQSSVVSGQWSDDESQMSVTRGQRDQRRSNAVTSRSEFRPLLVRPLEEEAVPQAPTAVPSPQPLAPEIRHPTPDTFSLFNPPLEALAAFSEDDFRRIFRHSPVKRAKYRGWLRNLCVAMGNSGNRRFVPWLEQARHHPDAVVREHAEWALERLKNKEVPVLEGTQPENQNRQ